MEDIGHAPTVEKEYEVLRKAVTNEYCDQAESTSC